MILQTKSFQAKKSRTDGIRICVMRRPALEFEFDLWLPHVAPSEELLQQYVIDKTMSWNEFQPKFLKELKKNKKYLELIIELTQNHSVTLLCWENTADSCHRSLLARECKKINKNLEIKLT